MTNIISFEELQRRRTAKKTLTQDEMINVVRKEVDIIKFINDNDIEKLKTVMVEYAGKDLRQIDLNPNIILLAMEVLQKAGVKEEDLLKNTKE